jgi:hypothetical protein
LLKTPEDVRALAAGKGIAQLNPASTLRLAHCIFSSAIRYHKTAILCASRNRSDDFHLACLVGKNVPVDTEQTPFGRVAPGDRDGIVQTLTSSWLWICGLTIFVVH